MEFAQTRTATAAQFVAADIGNDRTGMHTVRLSFINAAIVAALLGNATQFDNAATAASGRGHKAKAYAAGFAAVQRPAKWDYSGKATPEVRAAIAAAAEELTDKWSAAFLVEFPNDKPELTEEQKAERKAKRAAKVAAELAADGWLSPDAAEELRGQAKGYRVADLSPVALADAIASMVQSGQFDAASLRVMAGPINAAIKAMEPAAPAPAPAASAPAPAPAPAADEPAADEVNPERAAQQAAEDEARARALSAAAGEPAAPAAPAALVALVESAAKGSRARRARREPAMAA